MQKLVKATCPDRRCGTEFILAKDDLEDDAEVSCPRCGFEFDALESQPNPDDDEE